MAFLKDTDYAALITGEDLDIVMQSDAQTRAAAELMAEKQIAGYLRQRFDVGKIFTESTEEEEDTRDPLIIMYLVDLTLFHLFSSLPQRMGLEQRRIRYEDALRWLEDVAKGKVTPDLPIPDSTMQDPLPANWGSNEKQNHSW